MEAYASPRLFNSAPHLRQQSLIQLKVRIISYARVGLVIHVSIVLLTVVATQPSSTILFLFLGR